MSSVTNTIRLQNERNEHGPHKSFARTNITKLSCVKGCWNAKVYFPKSTGRQQAHARRTDENNRRVLRKPTLCKEPTWRSRFHWLHFECSLRNVLLLCPSRRFRFDRTIILRLLHAEPALGPALIVRAERLFVVGSPPLVTFWRWSAVTGQLVVWYRRISVGFSPWLTSTALS